MDLIKGKTMYCPECGKELIEFDGEMNYRGSKIANVNAKCSSCNKYYHWIAFVNTKTREHSITGFGHYFPNDK